MRKVVTLIMALAFVLSVRAEGEQLLLRHVAKYVAAMGSYDAEVDVTSGDYKASARYSVAGDIYHIKIGDAEVFSDGKSRYEIDHKRKEISADVVDLQSRNILDNPTRCFDFVGEEYVATKVAEKGDEVTLRLVAQDEEQEGEILLTLQVSTGKPLNIAYLLYDDRIDVAIRTISPRKSKIPTFSKGDFKGYDMVDFR
ncbi:MAG: hypothetical protein IJ434_04570 [Alistipes sp.]|nr:hypothetical protein [Alistipes sp.]